MSIDLKKAFDTLFEHVSLFRYLEKETDFVEAVTAAVQRLDSQGRTLITERYLRDPYVRDIHVYRDIMQISAMTHRKIRIFAFSRLNMLLDVAKMNEDAERRIASYTARQEVRDA